MITKIAHTYENKLQKQTMQEHEPTFRTAMVARPVSKAEMKLKPAAEEEVAKDWEKLRHVVCWEEANPRTLRSVKAEAARTMQEVHFADLHELSKGAVNCAWSRRQEV